jgi:uncharacterized membrane protein YphA (DoxX/SURF4 family)
MALIRSLFGTPGSRPSPGRHLVWFVIGAFLVCLLPPAGVAAHARWFTEEGPYSPPEWDRLVSLPVALALLAGAAAVVALGLLQRVLGDPLWPRPPFLQRLETSAAAILGVQTAITMIFMASRFNLFVPNIQLPRNVLGVLIAGVTVVAAFSFITGVLTRVGALITIGLVILAFAFAPAYEVLEQVIFVGIALYLVAVGRGVVRYDDRTEEDRSPLSDRLLPHALTILRVCAGISVLVLGFTEKLINVDLGVAFLDNYPRFNVAQEIGLTWFTDERFIYAVGIVEATAGIALLSGYLTRVVILALWIPFNLGIAFLPAEELIGHLPILSTMYVLLVRGTEGIPPPVEERPRTADPVPRQRAAPVAAPAQRA